MLMAIKKENIIKFILAITILLIPFTDLPLGTLFGELSSTAVFYWLIFVLGIWIFNFVIARNYKFYYSRHISTYYLLFFIVIILFSIIFNINDIYTNSFAGRSSFNRVTTQLSVLLFSVFFSLCLYNLLYKINLDLFFTRKYILFSFLLAGMYSLLELFYYLNILQLESIWDFFDSFLHVEIVRAGKLRSVTMEPSFLGMYLSFVTPWLLSYLLTSTRYKIIPIFLSLYLLLLTVLTFSRTAYFIIAFEFFLFIFFYWREIIKDKKLLYNLGLAICCIAILIAAFIPADLYVFSIGEQVIMSFFSNESIFQASNVSRFGIMVSAFKMFLVYPLFGVGIGQFAFYFQEFLPTWAVNTEILDWLNGYAWVPIFNIYARLLAETGILGLSIWSLLWFSVLSKLYSLYKKNRDVLILVLFISLLGVLLSGFNIDSFRNFSLWLVLALFWKLEDLYKERGLI